jgi:tetratricopeptide (TPR) repeat protein
LGLAQTFVFAGRAEEALLLLDKSMRLNPNYGFLTLFCLGQAHFMLGRYVDAIKAFERSTVHNPSFVGTKYFLAASYAEAGDFENAQDMVATLEKLDPELLGELLAMTAPYKRAEDLKDLMNALHKAGLSI